MKSQRTAITVLPFLLLTFFVACSSGGGGADDEDDSGDGGSGGEAGEEGAEEGGAGGKGGSNSGGKGGAPGNGGKGGGSAGSGGSAGGSAGSGGTAGSIGGSGGGSGGSAGTAGAAGSGGGGSAGSGGSGGSGGSMATDKLAAVPKTCVFLMLGQSNMSGMGAIEAQDLVTLPRTFRLAHNKMWYPGAEPWAINPYNSTSTGTLGDKSMSSSRAFAAELMSQLPNASERNFYIVNAAVSGSNIESWETKDSVNYKYMLPFLDEGLKKGPLCGFIWHQGEANGGTDPMVYATKLRGIRANIAAHANAPNLPWVAGQTGITGNANDNVAKALVLVAAADTRFAWASSAGLSLIDNVHYDARSQRVMGQRYAQKLVEVLKR